MSWIKFSVYVAIFIGLMGYLLSTLDVGTVKLSNEIEERAYVPISTKEIDQVNVTYEDLRKILKNWSFSRLDVSKSPYILEKKEEGENLKKLLIELLSESVRRITPKQYAHVADLVGVYNLTLNETLTPLDYSILTPYHPFNFSFEAYEPFSPLNMTYPPSAEIAINFVNQNRGLITAYAALKGYKTKKTTLCDFDWGSLGYYCREHEVVNVTVEEVYNFGGILGKNPIELSFVFPGEHEGCLYKEYSVENSFVNFYLRVGRCKAVEDYVISTELSSNRRELEGIIKRYNLILTGYHGEDKIDFEATCVYTVYYRPETEEYFKFSVDYGKKIEKKGQNWNISAPMVFISLGKTYTDCYYRVGDLIKVILDNETHEIRRNYDIGGSFYYSVPSPRGREEKLEFYLQELPQWVKEKFEYDPQRIESAEELLLRIYAEAARLASEKIINKDFKTINELSLWKNFFGEESKDSAKNVMEYFYLVQIPLEIKVNSSLNHDRFYSFLFKEGNESVVATLYTFFENSVPINATKTNITFSPFGSSKRERVETYLILADTKNTSFTPKSVKSSCGVISVAELAYYRQPGFQRLSDEILSLIPAEIEMHHGYSSLPGIIFETKNKTCNRS